MATSVQSRPALRWSLIVITAAGLAVDAYVHFHLASAYSGVKTSTMSQGDLFRVEATLAAIAAIAVVVRPRRYTAAFAFLVAAGGVAAVVFYRYVDTGVIGPLPNMYEPRWYGEKTLSLIAEAIAAVAALGLLALLHAEVRHASRAPARSTSGNAVQARD
jgi:hypothetical protein